jgi:hypothetical protein
VIYPDTSYLLKLYALERGSEELAVWLTGKSDLICARHGRLDAVGWQPPQPGSCS